MSTITRDAPVFNSEKYADLSKQFEAVRGELTPNPDMTKAQYDLTSLMEDLESCQRHRWTWLKGN